MERWKTIFAVGFLILAISFSIRIVADVSNVAASGSDTESTPANAIPIRCQEVVSPNNKDDIDCIRADSGASFLNVPAGHYVMVTDVLINRNSLAETGNYFVTIGADSTGILPATPHVQFTGTPLDTDSHHWQAPFIILGEGEHMEARNDSSSDFSVELFISGFLVDDVTYQRILNNYLPAVTRGE